MNESLGNNNNKDNQDNQESFHGDEISLLKEAILAGKNTETASLYTQLKQQISGNTEKNIAKNTEQEHVLEEGQYVEHVDQEKKEALDVGISSLQKALEELKQNYSHEQVISSKIDQLEALIMAEKVQKNDIDEFSVLSREQQQDILRAMPASTKRDQFIRILVNQEKNIVANEVHTDVKNIVRDFPFLAGIAKKAGVSIEDIA